MINFLIQPFISRYFLAALFGLMGLLHFIKPEAFIKVMSDYIPHHKAMVLASGVGELLGGISILIPKTRLLVVYGLLLLLLVVFPANINLAREAYKDYGLTEYT